MATNLRTKSQPKQQYTLIKPGRAAAIAGMSRETLKKYRLNGELILDIHWVRVNARVIFYRAELLESWASNRHNPDVHLREIETFLQHQKAGTSIDCLAPA